MTSIRNQRASADDEACVPVEVDAVRRQDTHRSASLIGTREVVPVDAIPAAAPHMAPPLVRLFPIRPPVRPPPPSRLPERHASAHPHSRALESGVANFDGAVRVARQVDAVHADERREAIDPQPARVAGRAGHAADREVVQLEDGSAAAGHSTGVWSEAVVGSASNGDRLVWPSTKVVASPGLAC